MSKWVGLTGLLLTNILAISFSVGVQAADASTPQILGFLKDFETELVATLDAASGKGTDQLALDIEKLSRKMADQAAKIPQKEISSAITWADVKNFYKTISPDRPFSLSVSNYRDAIAAANLRLQREGIDFIQITQDLNSELIESFRDFVKGKNVPIEKLKQLSNQIYSEGPVDEIKLPIDPEEYKRAMKKLGEKHDERIGRFIFRQDLQITSVEQVALPEFEKPLPEHVARQKKYAMWRTAISPTVAAFGGALGGEFKAPGYVSGLTGAALEVQFIKFSSRWANFWNKYKFRGNIAVNAGYCVIVTAAALLTEYALTGTSTMNLKEFLVKSLVLGTGTFVASFGAMQLASSKLKANGAFSEFTRFKLETWSVLFANLGRTIALGTAGMGLEKSVFTIADIGFKSGDLIGWGIQAAYLAAVTIPMWAKLNWGEKALDAQIKANFDTALGQPRQKPTGLLGNVKSGCSRFMASLARVYSVSRR